VAALKQRAKSWRRGFYSDALSEAEQLLLDQARDMEGLDEEIAMLRVHLRKALEASPDDLRLVTLGVDMLVKAVAAQYRLSPKARRDLAGHLTNLLNSLGDQLLPAGT
jgi:hypothetical protein